MRILVVTQYFWPETFIVNGLVSELIEKGHQVEVLTGLPNYPTGRIAKGYSLLKGPWSESYSGAKLSRVFLLPRANGFLRLSLNYVSFVISACIKVIFHKKDFDVIFCYAPSPITSCLPAIFLRWLSQKPLVFWVQDLWPESISAVGAVKADYFLRLIGGLVRFIYKRCDIILTQSKAFKNSVISWGGEEEKIKYIPNWAEPFTEANEVPAWVTQLPAGFKIGFAGNIGKAQDLPTLVAAAELLRSHADIKWIIAGEGSEKNYLDAEIKKKKLEEVIFTVGKRPYEEMSAFFKKCDALYVSLTDEFIFSLTVPAKVQAYMSAEVPILACLNGEGARIITEAQAGLTSPAKDAVLLSENVLKLKGLATEQRSQMGRNGLKYFNDHFEKNRVISQIEEILTKVLSKLN